jgi:hypothetical protein
MDIGEDGEIIVVEPVVEPVPGREPVPAAEPAEPVAPLEPEPVGRGAT